MTLITEKNYYPEHPTSPENFDGDFLSPEFNNPVRGIIEHDEDREYRANATIYHFDAHMQDGTRYNVKAALPTEKYAQAGSDIPIHMTTALGTQLDGMYDRQIDTLTSLGRSVLAVSIPQNYRWSNINHNAHNQLSIGSYLAPSLGLNSDYAEAIGTSRGAMTAENEQAVAWQHSIEIFNVDGVVPCYANGLKRPAGQLARHALLVIKEAQGVLDILATLPSSERLRYLKTVNISPREMVLQVKEIPSLLSGDVGKQIRQNMAKTACGYMRIYRDDIMSGADEWPILLSSHPNKVVDIRKKKGSHLAGAVAEPGFQDWRRRMEVVSSVIHNDPAIVTMGGTALRQALAQAAPAIYRQPSDEFLPEITLVE